MQVCLWNTGFTYVISSAGSPRCLGKCYLASSKAVTEIMLTKKGIVMAKSSISCLCLLTCIDVAIDFMAKSPVMIIHPVILLNAGL